MNRASTAGAAAVSIAAAAEDMGQKRFRSHGPDGAEPVIPPRSVLGTWRAVDHPDAPIDRRIADLAAASEWVRGVCGRLGGPGPRGIGHEPGPAVSTGDELRVCLRAAALCDIAERTLRDLYGTVSALSDLVADAEAAGCSVAENWTVTGGREGVAGEWAELVAEAVATVRHTDQRGHEAIRAAAAALLEVANVFERAGSGADRPPGPGPGHGQGRRSRRA
ncbi:hypothetical protein [Nocardia spumae]|uniref:hypothetical protein n=1 Tax=Nocardia spumae TaxID=2887190 RepID=UPI001D135AA1|nr:hypothetical protein [Nocardia spumae]